MKCNCSCSILKQMPLALILFIPPILSVVYALVINAITDASRTKAVSECLNATEQCIVDAKNKDPLTDMKESLSVVFTYMISALSFLLAMQLNSALKNNQIGVQQFGKLCEMLIRTSSQLCADPSVDMLKIKNIYHILSLMPGLVKHTFRNTVDIDKLYIRINPKGETTTLKDENIQIYNGIKQVFEHDKGEKGLTVFQSTMIVLLNEITKLSTDEKTMTTRAWTACYEMYGTVNNMFRSETPEMLTWFMNVSMAAFVCILPIKFIHISIFWACVSTFVISYFFLGLWIASRSVGNPFVSQKGSVFPTVSREAKNTTRTIMAVFREAKELRETTVPTGSTIKEQNLNFWVSRRTT